jgi:thiol-disulfide isomerase/thioredoxin
MQRMTMMLWLLWGSFLGATCLGCREQVTTDRVASAAEEKIAEASNAAGNNAAAKPDVSLAVLSFDELQKLIADRRGKIIVLDAWSTSCEPCMKEFPHLVELSGKYPEDLACISVSLDYEGLGKPEEAHERVLKFLIQKRATFANVLAADDSETMLKKLGIGSIPAVFVFGRDGKPARLFDCPGFTYHEVEAEVQRLLSAK